MLKIEVIKFEAQDIITASGIVEDTPKLEGDVAERNPLPEE